MIMLCVLTLPAEIMIVLSGAKESLINPQMMLIRTLYFIIASFLASLGTVFYAKTHVSMNMQLFIPFIFFGYGYLSLPMRATLNLKPHDIKRKKAASNNFFVGCILSTLVIYQVLERYNDSTILHEIAKEIFPAVMPLSQFITLSIAILIISCFWFTYISSISITTNPKIFLEIDR